MSIRSTGEKRQSSAEELLSTNVANKRTELVRGRLIVHEPPGGRHGYVAATLAFPLNQHVELSIESLC